MPPGDQLGPKSPTSIIFRPDPSGFTTATPDGVVNNIKASFVPSGDQSGHPPSMGLPLGALTKCGLEPSELTSHSSKQVVGNPFMSSQAKLRWKTIVPPSGDQAGWPSESEVGG